MKINRINICFLILLVLYTHIAKASNVTCTNLTKWKPAPLHYPITLNWTLSKLDTDYSLKLILTQIGSMKEPLFFPNITLLHTNMISESVTIITTGRKIEMNKLTFNNLPTPASKIIIFVSPDGKQLNLGYMKYISTANQKNYWGVISDYIVDPNESNRPFIDSYSFIGSENYTEKIGEASELECSYLTNK
ncbi:MAG: hypothetical protein K0R94_436 [Burkholderiales bacterium]|jgi:hypothetical protein|nr:hypothetical protein [Burkholderiales bacterium]